jgi:hypothetical protein
MNVLLPFYLHGLQILKEKVARGQSDYHVAAMLQIRLRENSEKMRIQGDTRDISGDRMEILSVANEMTERLFHMSFDDFCQLHIYGELPSEASKPSLDMSMTPAELEALKAALLSAFPSPGDLQQVVAFKLGENLSVISGGDNYSEVVFNLIQWAQSHAKIESLIAGARQVNPSSKGLEMFEEQYKAHRETMNYGGRDELRKIDPASFSSPSSSRSKSPRTTAFISYSSRDKKYLEELHTHLAHYIRKDAINVWDDTKILPGTRRREKIEEALQAAKVAVLLVSADFLASDAIVKDELLPLLDAAERGGATVLPVILRACAFSDSELAQYHPVNAPSNPLGAMTRGRRDAVWAKVAELVRDALKKVSAEGADEGLQSATPPPAAQDKGPSAPKYYTSTQGNIRQQHIGDYHTTNNYFFSEQDDS